MRQYIYLFVLLISLFGYSSRGQTNMQIQMLPDGSVPGEVQDTIVSWIIDFLHGGGGMIDTSSIIYTGNVAQFGRYSRGDDISKHCTPGYEGCMDEGLILSTGSVEEAGEYDPGNGRESQAFGFPPGTGGDPDLHSMYQLLGYEFFQVGDNASIEFTYIPYGDEIEMRYVFASEEYPNEISKDDVDLTDGSQMHDLFGIWVDLMPLVPGLDRFNAAIFPDFLGLPVPDNWITLSTINPGEHPQYYITNNDDGFPNQPLGTQFDGLTAPKVELRLSKSVQRCKEHNVKIAIEDFVFNDPETGESTFGINSAVLLAKGSLIGGTNEPSWSIDSLWETNHQSHEGKLIEDCSSLLLTITLDNTFTDPKYDVGIALYPDIYWENLDIRYTDEYGGGVITQDESYVRFENGGSLTKKIRITAKNLDQDLQNVLFSWKTDPCDKKNPFTALYSGIMTFDLIKNEPFAFDVNPKVYSGYCKETIEVTVTDITSGGVEPVYYLWPEVSVPPVDSYFHTIENSPDFITVEVKDYCNNDTTMQIRFDNKPMHLVDIPTISFCKPGMEQEVEVVPDMNYHDFPGYGYSNVDWTNLGYTPPQFIGSGNPFTIVYDDNFIEEIYYIKYDVTDVCGALTSDTVKVDQTGKLDAGDDHYICKGESVELVNFTPVFENDPDNYKWYERITASNWQLLGTGNSITVTPDDTTTIILEIYDKCEETQIDSIRIFVDHFAPQIVVTPSSREVCPGESVSFTANEANSYLWTPGGATTQSITVTEYDPGVYTYTLTASSDYCIDKEVSDSFEVFPQPEALFSFDPDEEACTGEEIQFTYGHDPTGKEFQWNFGDNTTSTAVNPVHTYNLEGLYTVYLHVQQYICEHDTTMTVLVNPLPSPDFQADVDEGCLPVTVNFNSGSSQDIADNAVFEWTFGDGTGSGEENPTHTYNEAGWYSVGLKITNTERCFADVFKSDLIQVNPNPLAGFEADPWIATMDDPEISFFNLSDSDSLLVDYAWDFGDGGSSSEENPIYTYNQPGDFDIHLRIETVNGCWDTVMGKVAITEFVKLYIPNAFTPNNDGLNDFFEIKGTPVTDWHLYIYDRWGGQVWSTHNFENLWDGRDYSGNPVPPAMYIYQITGTDYKKESFSYKGTVTVVR
ncbi:MAG: PKD domain-containing protein [bacterium]